MGYQKLSDKEIKDQVHHIVRKSNSQEDIENQIRALFGIEEDVVVSLAVSAGGKKNARIMMKNPSSGDILRITY